MEWHRRHDGTPFPGASFYTRQASRPSRPAAGANEEEQEELEEDIAPEDAVEEQRRGAVALLGETGEIDLMTQPLLRELLLLLVTTLEAPQVRKLSFEGGGNQSWSRIHSPSLPPRQQSWASLADLVREMIRQGGTSILMDLYWHGMSLLYQETGEEDGASLRDPTRSSPSFSPYQQGPHYHHDDGSEVTVDCPEHEFMHFSMFAIVLRLFDAMARYTPAAVQALLAQPQVGAGGHRSNEDRSP